MFCQKCGAEVSESQRFCGNCAASLTSSTAKSQPKRKHSRFARVMLWSLAILFGLVVLHGVTSNTEQGTQQNTPSLPTVETQQTQKPSPEEATRQNILGPQAVEEQQTQKPPFSVVEGNTTYHGAMSSNVGVAVLSVTSGMYLIGFEPIKADGKFVIVAVAVFNGQNSAIVMSTGLFEILDSNGNTYSASEHSMEVDSANNLFLAQINPGITKTGKIVFDVPQNLSMDNLLLRFRGGMTGESRTLALRVNAIVRDVPAPPIKEEPAPQEPPAQPNENPSGRPPAASPPKQIVQPSPQAAPTPPTPAQSSQTQMSGQFTGAVMNTTANQQASAELALQQTNGALTGCFLVFRPLYGSGQVTGSVHGAAFEFVATSPNFDIKFTGQKVGEQVNGVGVRNAG